MARRRARRATKATPRTVANALDGVPRLLDYFVELRPQDQRPTWLAPYADILERACAPKAKWLAGPPPEGYGRKRAVIAAPPQHGKTTLALVALLYFARYFPGHGHAYITYSHDRVKEVVEDFKAMALGAGFDVAGTTKYLKVRWGGNAWTRIKFQSVGGALTGYPLTGLCIIDDPVKGHEQAASKVQREKTHRWFRTSAYTRRGPYASYLCMATRWHENDLSGYLVATEKYPYINLRCECEAENDNDVDEQGRSKSDPLHRKPGEYLWPWLAAEKQGFKDERRNPYDWAALFQGRPRPREGAMFKRPGEHNVDGSVAGPGFYTKLPTVYRKIAFGADLAYSQSTKRDWSVLVLGLIDQQQNVYIVDVVRRQIEADAFADILKQQRGVQRGAPIRWYTGPAEKGVGQLMRKLGVTGMKVIPARANKVTRAIPASLAWNHGKILLPDPDELPKEWLEDFLAVIYAFTGEDDEHDDDVDALAALYDELTAYQKIGKAA